MKTTVVCGVLGSGKTTFLRNILKGGKERAVVLVNDFGSAGIDGEVLSAGGIEAIELPSGCVCCTLRFDLISSITKIMKQFQPEHLYIEPSGVAAPSGVLEVLETLRVDPVCVVGIVDATEFAESVEMEMYGWFFENQIVRSDIVLVNKTDLADDLHVQKTIQLIEEMNGNALVIPTVHAVIPADVLAHRGKAVKKMMNTHDHALRFETVTVHLSTNMKMKSMQLIFNVLAEGKYGNVLRAKALVQTEEGAFRFDLASGLVTSELFKKTIEYSRLVVIGMELSGEGIRELATMNR